MCLVKGDRKCFFGISLVFIVIIQLLMMFKYEVKPSADFDDINYVTILKRADS